MSYCHKCGAKLDENAKFCHVCGTPVAAPTAPPTVATRAEAPAKSRLPYIPVAILIAVLVATLVIVAFFFLPLSPVHFAQTDRVAKSGVQNLMLDFQADVAEVNVFFKDLPSNMVILNVTADGNTALFGDPNSVVNVTFNHQTTNNTEIVTSRVSRAMLWPLSYNLNVVCDIYINPSANLSLTVHSSVGRIVVNATTKVVIENLNLETTTGNIEARLTNGTVIGGSLSLRTTTGNVQFLMDEADVSGNVPVNLQSTTGAVNVNLAEKQKLSGNVTVEAGTTTGSVGLWMVIDGDVGARIESHSDFGRMITGDIQHFSGTPYFSGVQSPLESSNYPAGSNFLVNLRTTTGGIYVSAVYESSAVLS